MYTIIQFSPTGNAKYVAQGIFEALTSKLNTPMTIDILALEHTNPKEIPSNKHLVLIYPIHGFNAPRTVKRFVRNLPSRRFEQVSLIGVGCNTSWVNDAVSLELRECLEVKGYTVFVDEIIAMPLTFIMSFTDEMIKEQVREAKIAIAKIAQKIIDEKKERKVIKFKSKIINRVGRAESGASRLFGLELHAKKECTHCGLCVKECPEENISMDEKGNIRFGFKCLMCMRCIYSCPVNAITPRFSKFIPIHKGYSIQRYINEQK